MTADLHIHMVLDGVDYRHALDVHREEPKVSNIELCLAGYQRQGITFLRDGGDRLGVSLRTKALAKAYGIDYRTPVFPIHKKGHYGSFIGKGFSDFPEYFALLDEVTRLGGDFVKIMISGLIDFSTTGKLTEEGIPEDEIRTMIAGAHERGFAVMAHANGDKAVNAALDAGVETIEHGAFMGKETIERLAESQTVWIPTLSTIGNLIGSGRYPDSVLLTLLHQQQENAALAAEYGGRVGLGSDAGAFRVPHEKAAQDEYTYLRQALGQQTDSLLHRAEEFVREKFQR